MREFYRPREPELSLARINLNQLIVQVIELTRAKWRDVPQQHGAVIALRTELMSPLPEVMGAENEIRDALTNLIFNAVDAMPDGGTLTLRTHVLQDSSPDLDNTRVALEVSDTGLGMDEQTRRQCLEPFFTTKGERGTGMGLAMVYGMTQRHRAELQIDSSPGVGTTMRCIFAGASNAATVLQPHRSMQPLPSLRILLVDDDPMIIRALSEILRRDGHQVMTADGGQAGIDAFAAAHVTATAPLDTEGAGFDLVITDLGMPHVDGRKVAAAIKARAPTVPIIMLTGWGQRLLDNGTAPPYVDRILSKPPKLEELRRTLAELITHSNAVSSS
jgi:CheY-like chemotaxis protein/anti-sigma regulatory factor (Ser/Thr protein kinase)